MADPRTVIVGGGIVGLSCAYWHHVAGHAVTVIDRGLDAEKASHGNAGGIAVTECVPMACPGLIWSVPRWLLDPLGPLTIRPLYAPWLIRWLWHFYRAGRLAEFYRHADALAALNQRTYDDLRPLLTHIGRTEALMPTGALVLYANHHAFAADALRWRTKKERGVRFELLTRDEIVDLEPAVGPSKTFGVLEPDWSLIKDPEKLVKGLAEWLAADGVNLVTGDVTQIMVAGQRITGVRLATPLTFRANNVAIAAGAWSGTFAKQAGDRVLLESERGYNVTLANPSASIRSELIFAEEKFVVTPLAAGLRIGGAVEFAGLSGPPNFKRAKALLALARRHLPSLSVGSSIEWMGHRPSTPDSLPIIGPSPTVHGLYYAFGHGHLGLTQAATTGRVIADMTLGNPPVLDLTPYAIERFAP